MTPSRALGRHLLGLPGLTMPLAIGSSCALLLSLALGAHAPNLALRGSPSPLQHPQLRRSAALPVDSELPQAARATVSATLGAAYPAYHVERSRTTLSTVNPAQRLSVRFLPSGPTVRSGSAVLGLSLRASSYDGASDRVQAVTPSASANRVDYSRAMLDEWYVNGPLGLEQGFTIRSSEADRAPHGVTLALSISGNVRASRSPGGHALVLTRAGARPLRYGALSAHDASGRSLPSSLALRGDTLLLRVQTRGARFPVTLDPTIEQPAGPSPSDETGAGRFGFGVALSADGSTALVGAPGDNGYAGAAWIFTRTSDSSWSQQGSKLTAGGPQSGEAACSESEECGFGRSVALSADGNTALIGAPRASGEQGAAWVFTRSGESWSQFGGRLAGSVDAKGGGSFGLDVALSADGDTALVGAPRDALASGAAWVFSRSSSGFAQSAPAFTGSEELGGGYFGRGVALSSDGDTALIGAPGDDGYLGAAWAFTRTGAGWSALGGKLTGGGEESGAGRFGFSVALSSAGDTALIGARSDAQDAGAVWVFTRAGSSWAQQGPKLTGEGEIGEAQFGYSAALSADGNSALIGGPHDNTSVGAAWRFTRSGTTWTPQEKQVSDDPEHGKSAFGMGVALSADASGSLIGGPRAELGLGGAWGSLSTLEAPPPVTPVEETTASSQSGSSSSSGSSSGSSAPTASSGVLASSASALATPTLAATGNVVRLSGVVRVKLPGSNAFTLLAAGQQIPFGSIVDATGGRVSVTTIGPNGATQTMVFYEGEFKLTQRPNGLVVSTLAGGDFSGCRTTTRRRHRSRANANASATRGKRPVRKLWAEGHGSYSTKGNYASGAVLGTRWLTEDLCDGTLIRVVTDRVSVTNLLTHRHIVVSAGHSYFAKAPH